MNKFLETKNLQRLNHEEIENLHIPIMNKKTELVIKDVPTKKVQPDGFLVNSSKHLEELTPNLSNSYKN